MRINQETFDFGSEMTLTGTVTSSGALTIPRANIHFPDQLLERDGLFDDVTLRVRITANADATGQLGDVVSLNMSLRLDVDGGSLASNCRITPILLSLRSSAAGGVSYDAATGRMTIADHGFSVPGAEGCGSDLFGLVDYNVEIDNFFGIPGSDTDALITAVIDPKILLDAPPTLTPPAALLVGTNSGCTYVGSIGTATATDESGSPSITNDAPGAFPLGTTTVTWTATDATGNTTSATQDVTVSDDDPPDITAPSDLTVSANSGVNYVGPIGVASASDNCSSGAELTIISDAPDGFPPGTTTVTWTATDATGNAASAPQRVTVQLAVDIDIIPGTSSPIKLSGFPSVLTVVVHTTADADAALISPATATLGDGVGTEAPVKTFRGNPVAGLIDVDNDGDKDLVLAFNKADLVATGDLTTATITLIFQADRTDGIKVRAAESVTVIP